jgi:hypothetical protein
MQTSVTDVALSRRLPTTSLSFIVDIGRSILTPTPGGTLHLRPAVARASCSFRVRSTLRDPSRADLTFRPLSRSSWTLSSWTLRGGS